MEKMDHLSVAVIFRPAKWANTTQSNMSNGLEWSRREVRYASVREEKDHR